VTPPDTTPVIIPAAISRRFISVIGPAAQYVYQSCGRCVFRLIA